jgi:hypothetical protein
MNASVHFTVHGRGSISSLEIRAALIQVGGKPASRVVLLGEHVCAESVARYHRGSRSSSSKAGSVCKRQGRVVVFLPAFSRRVFKLPQQPLAVLMLTFKGFRRPTAKLAMPHVHHIDISIVGTELDVVGAQTVYVLQVCPRPILTGAPCARWPLPHAERRGVR